VLREIKKAGEIDDVEMKNSKNHIKGTFMRAKERMNALIEVLAFWDTIGDVSLFDKYVPRIMRINKAQVAKVVQKYLSGDVFTAIST
jgi:predicted Zn-dependent peptidase